MSEQSALNAGPSTSETVEELLRQLVDARFVLTDRDGAVTRWSRPAEELFGWPGARMLGRPLVDTLGLVHELPASGGRLQTVARRRDGHELEVALTLVPVRMSQSLEFNGFLEALEIAAPRGNALAQLQQSHRTVVDWIHAALRGEAHLEEDGLAAGTIVAFRPLKEPPAPAPADEEDDEPVGRVVIGSAVHAVQSESLERALEEAVAELEETREEATAARGEAAKASERLTDIEQAEAGLESELSDTRRVLDEMRAQVESLRGELDHARGASEEQARAERERAEREAEEARAERERLRRELEEMRTALEGMRRDLAGAPQAQERLRGQLEQMREKVGALESALSDEQGLAEWVDEVHARLSGFEEALAAAPGTETVQEAARLVRSELAQTQAKLDELEAQRAAEQGTLEAELSATRERLERIESERAGERRRSRPSCRARARSSRSWPERAGSPTSTRPSWRRPSASGSRPSWPRRGRASTGWRAHAPRSASTWRWSWRARAGGSRSWPERARPSSSAWRPSSRPPASSCESSSGPATRSAAAWPASWPRRAGSWRHWRTGWPPSASAPATSCGCAASWTSCAGGRRSWPRAPRASPAWAPS